jgi:secondary thiamine-phosphate synthase enzyme
MPREVLGYPSSTRGFLFFFVFLTLCFFPNLFIGLVKLPLSLLVPSIYHRPPIPTKPTCPYDCLSPLSTQTVPAQSPGKMSWFQKTLHLPSKSRGSYLITDTVVSQLPEIKNYKVGILHLFVQHTSCALSMNENWDEDVRADMSDALDRIVPEDKKGGLYRHDAEGRDDMPVCIPTSTYLIVRWSDLY